MLRVTLCSARALEMVLVPALAGARVVPNNFCSHSCPLSGWVAMSLPLNPKPFLNGLTGKPSQLIAPNDLGPRVSTLEGWKAQSTLSPSGSNSWLWADHFFFRLPGCPIQCLGIWEGDVKEWW
ncbi:Small nuclear ribonucleoprotein F, partial [Ophiophagus hannah]